MLFTLQEIFINFRFVRTCFYHSSYLDCVPNFTASTENLQSTLRVLYIFSTDSKFWNTAYSNELVSIVAAMVEASWNMLEHTMWTNVLLYKNNIKLSHGRQIKEPNWFAINNKAHILIGIISVLIKLYRYKKSLFHIVVFLIKLANKH